MDKLERQLASINRTLEVIATELKKMNQPPEPIVVTQDRPKESKPKHKAYK